MRLRATCALAAITLVGLLSGCGSSHHSPKRVTGKQREAALRTLIAMRSRLLKKGELREYEPTGRRKFGVDAASWIEALELPRTEVTPEIERLEKLGFQLGLQEGVVRIKGGPIEGVSIVEQFGAEAGARAELAYEVRKAETQGAREFAVTGVPTARGFGETGAAYNIAFASGRYYYLLGISFPPGERRAPTRADMITAAQRLYARVSRA
jgi:hypothetical protein